MNCHVFFWFTDFSTEKLLFLNHDLFLIKTAQQLALVILILVNKRFSLTDTKPYHKILSLTHSVLFCSSTENNTVRLFSDSVSKFVNDVQNTLEFMNFNQDQSPAWW